MLSLAKNDRLKELSLHWRVDAQQAFIDTGEASRAGEQCGLAVQRPARSRQEPVQKRIGVRSGLNARRFSCLTGTHIAIRRCPCGP